MYEHIENTVSSLRHRDETTQESLAEVLGVSRQTVIAIEKGNYTPSVLLALKIASHFKEPVERVFKVVHTK